MFWGLQVTEKDLSQFLLKITHKIETDQPYHHSDGQASCSNKDLIWKSNFANDLDYWIGLTFCKQEGPAIHFFCKSLGYLDGPSSYKKRGPDR